LSVHLRYGPYGGRTVWHHVISRHQVEIEVWPTRAEVYFQDERYEDVVNSQVRFDAVVYNASTSRVLWEVVSPHGGPGAGSIDAVGLYTAPPKGSSPDALTDIIVATAADDPQRGAYAWVSVVGIGAEPPLEPQIEIFPKQAFLFYPEGAHNRYMGRSNTMQLFRASIRNSELTEIVWRSDPPPESDVTEEPWFLYRASAVSGPEVTIEAHLKDEPSVRAKSKVVLLDYSWAGGVP
jgi:hypothetical protein